VVQAVAVASIADFILLPCSINDTTLWVVVDSKANGVSLVTGQMTHGEEVADVHLNDVVIADTFTLNGDVNSWLIPRIFACLASLQLGVSEVQIAKTVEYISERQQFGRAIGTFQAVQMTMADTKIALEALRSNLWQLCYR